MNQHSYIRLGLASLGWLLCGYPCQQLEIWATIPAWPTIVWPLHTPPYSSQVNYRPLHTPPYSSQVHYRPLHTPPYSCQVLYRPQHSSPYCTPLRYTGPLHTPPYSYQVHFTCLANNSYYFFRFYFSFALCRLLGAFRLTTETLFSRRVSSSVWL